MPLIPCRSCGTPVSGAAESCPKCGHPVASGFLGKRGTAFGCLNVGCAALIVALVVLALALIA